MVRNPSRNKQLYRPRLMGHRVEAVVPVNVVWNPGVAETRFDTMSPVESSACCAAADGLNNCAATADVAVQPCAFGAPLRGFGAGLRRHGRAFGIGSIDGLICLPETRAVRFTSTGSSGCSGKFPWFGIPRLVHQFCHGLHLHVAMLQLPLIVVFQEHGTD